MDSLVIPSTFVITSLLAVGLFFFLRAAGKDRTEERTYQVEATELDPAQIAQFLQARAYRLEAVDAAGIAHFKGHIQPSDGLTVLLSSLAAVGIACLVLVLHMIGLRTSLLWALLVLAPLAGQYYRSRNQGTDAVAVKITLDDVATHVWVQGHRDALDTLAHHFGWL